MGFEGVCFGDGDDEPVSGRLVVGEDDADESAGDGAGGRPSGASGAHVDVCPEDRVLVSGRGGGAEEPSVLECERAGVVVSGDDQQLAFAGAAVPCLQGGAGGCEAWRVELREVGGAAGGGAGGGVVPTVPGRDGDAEGAVDDVPVGEYAGAGEDAAAGGETIAELCSYPDGAADERLFQRA